MEFFGVNVKKYKKYHTNKFHAFHPSNFIQSVSGYCELSTI